MADERLLIVDDELAIRMALKTAFARERMEVSEASCGTEALALLKTQEFDLIVLDIMMEHIDGYAILQQLRADGVMTPVLMLSGKQEETDQVLGLGMGADDYLTKPFHLSVLIQKAKALIRRNRVYSHQKNNGVLVGPFRFDTMKLECYKNGERLNLTARELVLFRFFLEHPGQVFTKEPCTVVCAMNLNQIYQQIVAPVQIGKGRYSIVKDRDLVILMHHAPSQIGIDAAYDRNVRYPQLNLQDLFEWVTMQQNHPEGSRIIHSYVWDDPKLAPEKRIVAYTTIHVSGEEWIVNSTLPYEELNEPLSRMVRRLCGMSALFLLLLTAFVYFMTRILMQAGAQIKEIVYLKEINQGMELLRHKEEEIQRYERMQSIGQMSSHIAHEFNNYLTPVLLYGEILESDDSISAQNQEMIHGIIKSVEEAAALSRRLLDFSRQDSYGEWIAQDLRREVAEACQVACRMVVVDDDPKVLKALDSMLRNIPVKVEYCGHPAAALSLVQKQKNDYDMLLTDYQMPSMNGLELSAMIRRLNPQIRLVLMSGLDVSRFDWYLKNRMIDEFIPKTELGRRLKKLVAN